MSEIAKRLIEQNRQTKAPFLDLGNCGLVNLPEELFDCTWLERLNLGETYRDEEGENIYTPNSGKQNILNSATLNGLQQLVNLRSLFLRRTGTNNLKPLQELLNLKQLSLSYNYMADLSPLIRLTKLQELYLGNNQLSNLSALENMVGLQRLYVGYNHIADISPLKNMVHLQKLVLANNSISLLEPISALRSLQELNITNNHISDISSLKKLVKLERLNLSGNQIRDSTPLHGLMNLRNLNLSNNYISDIKPFQELNKLQELILTANEISTVDEQWIDSMQNLEDLYLIGNPIQNIPTEIYERFNCFQDIKNYFKDKRKGSIPVYEAKVILVGNGRVGKTCLVKRLVENTFDAEEPSTHAIQLREWELSELATELGVQKVKVNLWDFGGQDIYHATHRLFLNTKALFILVWDKQTQVVSQQTETLPTGRAITYQNHSFNYWLSHIKALSSNSPVLVVQSKKGQDGEIIPCISADEKEQYNIWRTHSIESSWSKVKGGFHSLQASLEEVIAEQVQNNCTEIPLQWFSIREQIAEQQQQGNTQMALEEFKTICQQKGLDESSTHTLLHYLHNTGVFFYKQGLFNSLIVINQKWAIDAVYTLFDRKGYFTRIHNKGEFTGTDLQEAWSNYGQEEQELFISFMKECAICFEVDENENAEQNTPFGKRRFIAPQLLPETKPTLVDFVFDGNNEVYYNYQHRFLHAAVLQRFMVRVGFLVSLNEMWREGMLIRTEEGTALIQTFSDRHQLLIRIKGPQKQALLARIKDELQFINKDDLGIMESVSLDGKTFVSLIKLKNHPDQNKQLQAEDGTWVSFIDYEQFLTDTGNKSFDVFKNTAAQKLKHPQTPEIFFSYAWGQELVVDKLYNSLQVGGYRVVRDKKEVGYTDLISDFMQRMGRGDLIVVVISEKYLRSKFCMYELYEIYRNVKFQKEELLKRILPIQLQQIDFSNPTVLRDYFEYWTCLEKEWKELVNNYGADQGEHRKIEAIKNALRDLLPFVGYINTMTIEQLTASNFQLIKKAIAKRIKELIDV